MPVIVRNQRFQSSRWMKVSFVIIVLVGALFVGVSFVTAQSKVDVDFSFINEWGTYNGTVYYVEGGVDVPIVIFLHGLGSSKGSHTWMVDSFLEAGYVFVMFNVPGGVLDVLSGDLKIDPFVDGWSLCIDELMGLEELSGVANFELMGAVGHSAGGLGALVAATGDSRIRVVVALSPPINLHPMLPKPTTFNIPIQLQVGTYEGDLYEGVVLYYEEDLVAPVKELVVIEGGNHVQYMDESIVAWINLLSNFMEIPYVGNLTSDITVEEHHLKSSQAYLRFFNTHLVYEEINVPPTAEFTYSPAEPTIQDLINFIDSSMDSDGQVVSWLWDFGDGAISSLQDSTHTFSLEGDYIVTLTVWDDKNATAIFSTRISVTENAGFPLWVIGTVILGSLIIVIYIVYLFIKKERRSLQ